MPLWLISIGLWFKKNPVQALQMLAVATVAGLAIWLYLDYTGTKRENASLKDRVEQAEANYTAATKRIDEFVAAQIQFEADLEALRQSSIAIRGQVREALKGLTAMEIEREYRDNPVEAEAAVNERLGFLFGMFEHVTGSPPRPSTTGPASSSPNRVEAR
jgi:hypothetical protein